MAQSQEPRGPADPGRRDVVLRIPELVTALGIAAVWPLFDRMQPPDRERPSSTVDFDLSTLAPGGLKTVTLAAAPVFIRRMTPEAMIAARDTSLDDLKDKSARNANRPRADAALANRLVGPDLLVMSAICTHLGCIPLADQGDYGGWFCPCHGSHYDTAGRVRKGPAPENLGIPKVSFLSETIIRIG